ncbi:MAG: hypothetical protein RMX96_15275 [Nostoc sp. ChiSLP02]|nr:hypothetical protein [Nostoc sp. DedSLP05]MDZ8101856.1 hypothetical protein [Nostoc sp. DedSLP01]MDZ8186202.1 hypothetical protein [Nostoc sp. ChiSLP02]
MVLLKWKACVTAVTLTAIAFTGSKSAFAASLYSLTDLGSLTGETYSYATDINDSGEVAINSLNSSFFYSNGSVKTISPLPGDNELGVTGINNLGQVVGNSVGANFTNNPFLYSNGITQPLAIENAIPYGINDRTQIVGGSTGLGAFLYSNGVATSIGIPGAGAYNLNNSGQVVGILNSNRAFLYQNGQTTNLGTLPSDNYSTANNINDLGQVVGTSGLSDINDGRAFLYSSTTGLQDLGRLRPTDSFSVGLGINNLGQVVGFSGNNNDFFTTDSNGLRAFLYSDNTLYDLNDLIAPGSNPGFTLTAASAINNKGQIVGRGAVNGELRAFLLTPISSVSVTEPTSGIPILSFGGLLILLAAFKGKPHTSPED